MKHKKLIFVLTLVVLLAGMVYGTALAKKSPVSEEFVLWNITKPKVTDQGQTIVLDEGTLITGYTIEAKAKAKHNNVVPDGKIVITLSAFSPAREMPGQTPGTWYIQGDWVITKKNASKVSAETRHSPDKAEGKIKAELPFNPLTSPGDWSGLALVPMSPTAGQWSLGEGSITLDETYAGQLMLDLTRSAELK